jgi:tetratricopeptide (TPR) repeat protein
MPRVLSAFLLATACGEPATAPPSAPAATASLDVPPLPPPHASAAKPAVRQAATPPTSDPNDESPLPNDPVAAQIAFDDGQRATIAGDIEKARRLFLRSYRLDPVAGALLNLASSEEKLGRRDDAIRHFQAAYDMSMKEGRKDRAGFAKSRLDELKRQP